MTHYGKNKITDYAGVCSMAFVSAWLLFGAGCGSAPRTAPATDNGRPPWTMGSVRTEVNGQITFVGTGEDRELANAQAKARAFALQDLANECTFVPRGAQVDMQTFEQEAGIIHRSFARVSVSAGTCAAAHSTLAPADIRAKADPTMQAEVKTYQTDYDPPEPGELGHGAAGAGVETDPLIEVFALREQLALKKQDTILGAGSSAAELSKLAQSVAAYEKSHPEATFEAHAFSERRLNGVAHQPSAVRDTVAERARLEKAYPTTPAPSRAYPGRGPVWRGRYRRYAAPPPTTTSPNPPMDGAQPSPTPSPGL